MEINQKPNIDEFFEAFASSIIDNLPISIKPIGRIIYPYISKAKESIHNIIQINQEGQIIFDINKEKIDLIIGDFIKNQGFIVRNIIKPILRSNYIDNMDNFIKSVKDGKNNYEKTTESIIKIIINTKDKMSIKYNISEDQNTISKKIKNIFL